jgi:hypothetical protein
VSRLILYPHRAHRTDAVVSPPTPRGEVDAHRVALAAHVSHSNAGDDPTTAQVIQRGELLGQGHRFMLREQQHTGAKDQAIRYRRSRRERDHWVDQVCRWVQWGRRRRWIHEYRVLTEARGFEARQFQRLDDLDDADLVG